MSDIFFEEVNVEDKRWPTESPKFNPIEKFCKTKSRGWVTKFKLYQNEKI